MNAWGGDSALPGPLAPPANPSAGNAFLSPDGRLRWMEGDSFVTVAEDEERPERKVKLPPIASRASKRRVLFAERSSRFCLLEEGDSELGLHLGTRRGHEKAKALVVASKLHLIDSNGRILWSRRLPEKAIVGRAADARSLLIANDGTLALLLQDVDPYGKARPMLLAISPKGRDLLSLDSTAWSRIEEFKLSLDGSALAVRGFGFVPEDENWSKAFGYYPLRSGKARVHPVHKASGGGGSLLGFDAEGWVCCVREDGKSYAFGPLGPRKAVEERERLLRFRN
ncbi:MAG: hypothetical protein AAB339_04100 [Elusimicrobiota bacterium]